MSLDYHERLLKADINVSTLGDNTIIAAPTDGRYIVIDFIQINPTSAVTIQFKDGTTNYGGPLPLAQGQVITDENSMCNIDGVITCGINNAFVINLGSAVQIGGFIRYRLIGN